MEHGGRLSCTPLSSGPLGALGLILWQIQLVAILDIPVGSMDNKAAMDAAIAKASELSADAVVKALGTDAKRGLSESAVAARREAYGLNKVRHSPCFACVALCSRVARGLR